MSMITISTVGFQEVKPLSEEGRWFTAFYILYNIATLAYTISVISPYIFEGKLKNVWKVYMEEHEIQQYKGHIIVCGFGRNGQRAVRDLLANQEKVVVIELEPEGEHENRIRNENLKYLHGDATQDELLEKAGVRKAKALISSLPKDADNVFVTLTARGLNPDLQIVARASEKNTGQKLIRAGADSVIMPDEIGGSHMARLITSPEIIHFLDLLTGDGPNPMNLEEIHVTRLRPKYRNCSIKELDIHNSTGATLLGISRGKGDYLVSPELEVHLQTGDVLILLGSAKSVKNFMDTFT